MEKFKPANLFSFDESESPARGSSNSTSSANKPRLFFDDAPVVNDPFFSVLSSTAPKPKTTVEKEKEKEKTKEKDLSPVTLKLPKFDFEEDAELEALLKPLSKPPPSSVPNASTTSSPSPSPPPIQHQQSACSNESTANLPQPSLVRNPLLPPVQTAKIAAPPAVVTPSFGKPVGNNSNNTAKPPFVPSFDKPVSSAPAFVGNSEKITSALTQNKPEVGQKTSTVVEEAVDSNVTQSSNDGNNDSNRDSQEKTTTNSNAKSSSNLSLSSNPPSNLSSIRSKSPNLSFSNNLRSPSRPLPPSNLMSKFSVNPANIEAPTTLASTTNAAPDKVNDAFFSNKKVAPAIEPKKFVFSMPKLSTPVDSSTVPSTTTTPTTTASSKQPFSFPSFGKVTDASNRKTSTTSNLEPQQTLSSTNSGNSNNNAINTMLPPPQIRPSNIIQDLPNNVSPAIRPIPFQTEKPASNPNATQKPFERPQKEPEAMSNRMDVDNVLSEANTAPPPLSHNNQNHSHNTASHLALPTHQQKSPTFSFSTPPSISKAPITPSMSLNSNHSQNTTSKVETLINQVQQMNQDLEQETELLKEMSVKLYLLQSEILFMDSPIVREEYDILSKKCLALLESYEK